MWSANLKLHSSKVEKKYEAVYLRYGPSQKEQERQFYQVDLMSSDESKSELKKVRKTLDMTNSCSCVK